MFAGTYLRSCVPTRSRGTVSILAPLMKAQVQLKDISLVEIVRGATHIPILKAQPSKKEMASNGQRQSITGREVLRYIRRA